ncbi:MAG: OmpA family protein [Thermodesulfobacteriota bacterium]
MGQKITITAGVLAVVTALLLISNLSLKKTAVLDKENFQAELAVTTSQIETITADLKTAREEGKKVKIVADQVPKLVKSLAEASAIQEQRGEEIKGLQVELSQAKAEIEELTQVREQLKILQQSLAQKNNKLELALTALGDMETGLKEKGQELVSKFHELGEKDLLIDGLHEKLEAARSEIVSFHSVMDTSKFNLDLVLDDLALKTGEISRLKDIIEKMAGAFIEKGTELIALKDKKEVIKAELIALADSIQAGSDFESSEDKADNADMEILQAKVEEKEEMIQALSREVDRLLLVNDEMTLAYETEMANIQGLADSAAAELEDRDKVIAKMQNSVKGQDSKSEELGRRVEELQAARDELTKAVGELEKSNSALADEKGGLSDQLKAIQESSASENEAFKAALADKEKAIEEQISAGSAQIAPLEEKLATLEAQFQTATNEKEAALAKLEATDEDLHAARKEVARLNGLVSNMDEARAGIELKLATLEKENDSIRSGLLQADKEKEGAASKLEPVLAELAVLKTQLEKSANSQEMLKTEIDTLAKQKQEGDIRIVELEAQLGSSSDDAVSEVIQKEHDAATEELAAVKAREADAVIEVEQLKSEMTSLVDRLRASENAASVTANDLKNRETKLAELQQAMAGLEKQSQTAAEQESRVAGLIEDIGKEKELLAEKETIIEALNQKIVAMDLESQKMVDELGALKAAQSEVSTAELETVRAELSEKENELKAALEAEAALKSEIEKVKAENRDLQLHLTDSDQDSVSDAEDKCPQTVSGSEVDAQGCEKDSDNDGLVNRLDLCKGTAAAAAIDGIGCSEEQTVIILEDITFQLGTAQLTEEAVKGLTTVGQILVSYPELRLEVAGHTDSIGDDARNMSLSEQRAQSVMQFLVELGVGEDRLKAKGYGSAMPIGSNNTELGRMKNRRVELRKTTESVEEQAGETEEAAPAEEKAKEETVEEEKVETTGESSQEVQPSAEASN